MIGAFWDVFTFNPVVIVQQLYILLAWVERVQFSVRPNDEVSNTDKTGWVDIAFLNLAGE